MDLRQPIAMKECVKLILEQFIESYPQLKTCRYSIEQAFVLLKECYDTGGKVLVCGNGGSAADSEHIVGELMKGFVLKRPLEEDKAGKLKAAFPENGDYLAQNLQGALPAISLISQSALSTAFINDVGADMVYAQQVYGYGKAGDVLIGLSTSGNAGNVCNALKVARTFGLKSLGMTGESGGRMQDLCDVMIRVPENRTYKIQELHLPVYHALCGMIEAQYFNG